MEFAVAILVVVVISGFAVPLAIYTWLNLYNEYKMMKRRW